MAEVRLSVVFVRYRVDVCHELFILRLPFNVLNAKRQTFLYQTRSNLLVDIKLYATQDIYMDRKEFINSCHTQDI